MDRLISERAVLDAIAVFIKNNDSVAKLILNINAIPSAEPKVKQWKDFALWVAIEIFDEWEYNKDAFAEIACRKLAKLGIVRAKGDEWELVEPQEGANKI